MATYDQAVAAKDSFKENYWSKSSNLYNIISVGLDMIIDENTEEILVEEYYVQAFLFDLSDADGLPYTILDVPIRYRAVMGDEVVI